MLTFFITLFAILFLAASSDTCRRLSPSSETMQLNLKVPLSHLFPERDFPNNRVSSEAESTNWRARAPAAAFKIPFRS